MLIDEKRGDYTYKCVSMSERKMKGSAKASGLVVLADAAVSLQFSWKILHDW